MSNKSLTALIVGVVVVIAAWNCFYIVAQTERAVLLPPWLAPPEAACPCVPRGPR